MEEITRSWAPHPGEFIREEIEARGWSQRDLAYILDCPEQAVNMILSGKRGVSPEMAKALGKAFDVPALLFSNLQKSYDLAQAKEPDPGIEKRAKIQAHYPIREMIKRGWLENTDASMLEAQVARFFEVNDVAEVPHLAHAGKKTESTYEDIPPEQLAWLFRVKQIAKSIEVSAYSDTSLKSALPRLKQLLIDPEEIRHVPRILMEAGVRLIFVEALPGSKIDGACFWLRDAPVIGMSLRHDRIDNFWFVLPHEIEHALRRHGQNTPGIIDADMLETAMAKISLDDRHQRVRFYNSKLRNVQDEEDTANAAAADFCVPVSQMNSFIARHKPFFSERDVIGFARLTQRHPGLIVGQIQNKTKRWDFLRKHLVKIRPFLTHGATIDGWGQAFPTQL